MYLKYRLEVDPYYVILPKGWGFWAWWSSGLATARKGLSSLAPDMGSLLGKVSPTQPTPPYWEKELARKWEIHVTGGKEVSDFLAKMNYFYF